MFHESGLISKLNMIADWIIRLVVLNILIIALALPIITLFPALSAGYSVFQDYINHKEVKLIPSFVHYFKEDIGKKIVFGVVMIVVIFLSAYNGMYYASLSNSDTSTFYIIGYYVTIAFSLSALAILLFSLPVFKVVKNITFKNTLKLSFLLAGKYFYISALLIMLTVSPVLLLYNYLTALILVFMGVSLPLLLNVMITRRAVIYLEGLVQKNGKNWN